MKKEGEKEERGRDTKEIDIYTPTVDVVKSACI